MAFDELSSIITNVKQNLRDFVTFCAYDRTIKAKEGSVMLFYLGWIIAAFLGGVLFACWYQRKRHNMAKRFAPIPCYRGSRYAEIVEAVGMLPQCERRKANGHVVRTWSDQKYSITLLFDEA
ncbi:MAG: hypothetical protein RR142_11255, partial [Clostridia bacterium]